MEKQRGQGGGRHQGCGQIQPGEPAQRGCRFPVDVEGGEGEQRERQPEGIGGGARGWGVVDDGVDVPHELARHPAGKRGEQQQASSGLRRASHRPHAPGEQHEGGQAGGGPRHVGRKRHRIALRHEVDSDAGADGQRREQDCRAHGQRVPSRMLRTTRIRPGRWMGLVRYSVAPLSRRLATRSGIASALRMTTGIGSVDG